jgi:membrane-associated protease RseP (regulator of RpoE activity)
MRPSPLTPLHILLFILTCITTVMVGAELTTGRYWFFENGNGLVFEDWVEGLPYALSFLAFLTFHEFGHFLTAIYHRVKTSWPYYIPLYIPGILNIGSLGAVIRLRQVPESTRKFFDIGIAGPLAGFVVSIFLLVYGFTHLPDKQEYMYQINPEYERLFGYVPSEQQMMDYIEVEALAAMRVAEETDQPVEIKAYYYVGTSLLFEWLKDLLADPEQVPTHFDLINYPFLFVGYITLFFTALNLLPIGQLDGGHIIYGMFGRRTAGIVARVTVMALIFMGGTGLVNLQPVDVVEYVAVFIYIVFLSFLIRKMFVRLQTYQHILITTAILLMQALIKYYLPDLQMNFIWLLYAGLVSFLAGLDHPEAYLEHRVNLPRQLLGVLAILIFILCFTPVPLDIVVGGQ